MINDWVIVTPPLRNNGAHILHETMENFKLKEGEDYIPLKDLIKLLGWVDTGGEAMAVIDNQGVKVNGETETQRRKKVRSGDVVTCDGNQARVE